MSEQVPNRFRIQRHGSIVRDQRHGLIFRESSGKRNYQLVPGDFEPWVDSMIHVVAIAWTDQSGNWIQIEKISELPLPPVGDTFIPAGK